MRLNHRSLNSYGSGLWIAGVMLVGCLTGCGATRSDSSQVQATINDIENSQWQTTYKDDAGTFSVNAKMTISGESGSYSLSNGQKGKLEDLVYAYITPEPEVKVGVYGGWSMAGVSGNFTFRVQADGKSFIGEWVNGNQRGSWNGTRLP